MAKDKALTNGKVVAPEGAALESVRRLEESLEDRRELQRAAEERLAAAREEAGRIVREAREEARRAVEERRYRVMAAAEEEAGRVLAEGKAEAGTLRALAEGDRRAAVRLVLDHVLPIPGRES